MKIHSIDTDVTIKNGYRSDGFMQFTNMRLDLDDMSVCRLHAAFFSYVDRCIAYASRYASIKLVYNRDFHKVYECKLVDGNTIRLKFKGLYFTGSEIHKDLEDKFEISLISIADTFVIDFDKCYKLFKIEFQNYARRLFND